MRRGGWCRRHCKTKTKIESSSKDISLIWKENELFTSSATLFKVGKIFRAEGFDGVSISEMKYCCVFFDFFGADGGSCRIFCNLTGEQCETSEDLFVMRRGDITLFFSVTKTLLGPLTGVDIINEDDDAGGARRF